MVATSCGILVPVKSSQIYTLWRNPQRGGDGSRLCFRVPPALPPPFPFPPPSFVEPQGEDHIWVELENRAALGVKLKIFDTLDEQELGYGHTTTLRIRVARKVWENLVNEGWEPLSPTPPTPDLPPARDWMGET